MRLWKLIGAESLEARTHLSAAIAQDGWTYFTQNSSDQTIYVSNSEGSDGNDGLTSAHPVRTVAKGIALLRDGHGDWMLLKNGDVWNESLGYWTKSGASADDPIRIGAYGKGDRAVLETGKDSGIIFANQTVKHVTITGMYFHANQRDPDSPDFVDTSGGEFGLHAAFPIDDLLLENCVFDSYQSNVSVEGRMAGPSGNLRLRRNVIIDSYNTSGHSEGLYVYNVRNVTLEDNLFDHNGWREGLAGAEATIFNHDAYIAAENSGVVVRGNIFANAASHGLQARAGGKIQGNLFLRNPIGMLFGLGQTATPGGVEGDVSGNVFLETASINGQGRGWGLEMGNIKPGGTTIVRNNIFAQDNQRNFPAIMLAYGGNVVSNNQDAVGVNDLLIENNIVYKWFRGMSVDSALESGRTGAKAISDLIVRNNDFQRIYDNQMITHGAELDPRQEKFAGNHYFNDGDTRNWFSNNGTTTSWDSWYAKVESTGTRRKMRYFNPERTVQTYNASLGGAASLGAFLEEARQQSQRYWRDAYGSEAVLEYVRQGFSAKGGAPAVTATNLTSKNTRTAAKTMTFYFNTDVSDQLSTSDLKITNRWTGKTIDWWNIQLDYDKNTNIATFTFPGLVNQAIGAGTYDVRLTASTIADQRGTALDGNGDGAGGDDFLRALRVR